MILINKMIYVDQTKQKTLVEAVNFELKSFNFLGELILIEALIEVVLIHIFEVSVENLDSLFKCEHVQEIDVDYTVFVYVSFAQETGDILEQ